MPALLSDTRCVLSLDAGGSSFRFFALRGGRQIGERVVLPTFADDFEKSTANLKEGFAAILEQQRAQGIEVVAISFGFPGPMNYDLGITGDMPNIPAYKIGFPMAGMLEEAFGLPVFINNDANLFAYGEALAGLLPAINQKLVEAGVEKQFRNLVGVTLGTGFGGGIVLDGQLLRGDNSLGGEVHLLTNPLRPGQNIEESISIRAVKREYAEAAGIDPAEAPTPFEIEQIARGELPGNRAAALDSYERMGIAIGDALAQLLTTIDGLAVIGGGISAGWQLFAPAMFKVLNGRFEKARRGRLDVPAYDLTDEVQVHTFLTRNITEVKSSDGQMHRYDIQGRTGVGRSVLGTSEAIGMGAYAYALGRLGAS